MMSRAKVFPLAWAWAIKNPTVVVVADRVPTEERAKGMPLKGGGRRVFHSDGPRLVFIFFFFFSVCYSVCACQQRHQQSYK